MALHDSFDAVLFMPRDHNEVRDVPRDPVVFSRRELDRVDAPFSSALTVERQELVDAMLLCSLLNPLVDRSKDFLVVGGRVRKVH